jgi:RES domain-containing protein
MIVYRICIAKYSGRLTASGIAGRWNGQGQKVIYAAESRALACLEHLVHRSGEGDNSLYRIMLIKLPPVKNLLTEIIEKDLPPGWNLPGNASCRSVGSKWYDSRQSLVLKSPSAIIKSEHNYIINTQHPSFKKIILLTSEPFFLDPRL